MATGAMAAATIGSAIIASKASSSANKAALKGADIQAQAAMHAAELQRETQKQVRKDTWPFRRVGGREASRLADVDIPGLRSLITSPMTQRKYVTQNPFFKSMADEAQSRLFQSEAARGKVGSGGTAKALQNSLLLLGSDLVNQNINQRLGLIGASQNLTSTGLNAAVQTGMGAIQGAGNIGDLMTQRGNVLAAGQVAQRSPLLAGLNTGMATGANLYSLFGNSATAQRGTPAPITSSAGTAPLISGGGGAPVYASI